MKSLASFIAGFVTALTLAAGAANITFTTTGAQDARLVAAFTDKLQPGCPSACRNATAADIKAWIAAELEAVVRNFEYVQAQQAISTQPLNAN